MTDISTAGRALLAAAGSALVLGTTGAPAFADDLDARHFSINQGAECAVRDVGLTGEHVLTTGALPRAFNDVRTTSGADGVRALCHAVEPSATKTSKTSKTPEAAKTPKAAGAVKAAQTAKAPKAAGAVKASKAPAHAGLASRDTHADGARTAPAGAANRPTASQGPLGPVQGLLGGLPIGG